MDNDDKSMKVQQIYQELGLDNYEKLKDIRLIPREFGSTEEDLLELQFFDGAKSYIPLGDIIFFYNYEKERKIKMNRCLYCQNEKDVLVGGCFCSEECARKWEIKDSFETVEDDEVICPYCGKAQSDIADGGGYYEADGEVFNCDYCDREFHLIANPHTTFTATPTEEMVDRIYDGDEQLGDDI